LGDPKDHDDPLPNAWLLPDTVDFKFPNAWQLSDTVGFNGYFGAMHWYVLLLVGDFMKCLYIFLYVLIVDISIVGFFV
jgi:hypothetical protein